MRYKLFFIIYTLFFLNTYNNELTLGLVGDVMLGRLVNTVLQTRSPTYIWGTVLKALKQNDVNFINLECAITDYNKAVFKVFNFKTDPKNINVLKIGNITGVNLANNHSLDFGIQGLLDTITNLKKNNIGFTGAGKTLEEAQYPFIVEKKGIRIAFFGFTDNEPTWKADKDKPGTNYIEINHQNISKVLSIIKPWRKLIDFIVVSLHWGPNMREKPQKKFIDFAHALIDNEVDIIHGHSAHLIQGIEVYKNKLILYDTGDFIDDYMVHQAPLRNDLTFLFNITFNKKNIKKLELIPCKIENMQVNKLKKSQEKSFLLNHINMLSKPFNTKIKSNNSWQINI